jgi:hypothetical protein
LQCLAPDQSSAINKAIERALAGIDEAFTFNPPGSGR